MTPGRKDGCSLLVKTKAKANTEILGQKRPRMTNKSGAGYLSRAESEAPW